MTREAKDHYQNTDVLRKVIQQLKGQKFRLDCGHFITFGSHLGNHITIYNGKRPVIVCSLCGY